MRTSTRGLTCLRACWKPMRGFARGVGRATRRRAQQITLGRLPRLGRRHEQRAGPRQRRHGRSSGHGRPNPDGAAEAAEIMADAAQRARRQFRVSHRVTFTVWGLGLLLGYGTMWLTVRGQRPPHGPDLATFAVVTLLGVGSVMSGVNEARADSGVGGLSAIRRRASFLSVLIGLAAMFALGGALAHAGASQAVISVFEASAPSWWRSVLPQHEHRAAELADGRPRA